MVHVIKDRIRESASVTGLGDFTLSGAVTNFDPFSADMSNGDTCWGCAVSSAGGWEVGLYTKITGGLARTTIYQSSNADAKVNFNAGGAGVVDLFMVIPSNAVFTAAGGTLTGALNWAAAATVASASTADIGAAASNYVNITGTTTVTALGTIASGAMRWVKFAGALTLTQNATSLINLGGANITTAAGDTALFVSEGSGNWRMLDFARASGAPLVPSAGGDATNNIGYLNIPQNSQSAAYTLVLSDAGKHILHPSADTTARIFTIPANSSVAYPVGTAITFINQNAAGVVTIPITTDTMRLAGAGTTGSRTLAANGIATAVKITSTEWIISGTGLT